LARMVDKDVKKSRYQMKIYGRITLFLSKYLG